MNFRHFKNWTFKVWHCGSHKSRKINSSAAKQFSSSITLGKESSVGGLASVLHAGVS